jgi:hypothetical protein
LPEDWILVLRESAKRDFFARSARYIPIIAGVLKSVHVQDAISQYPKLLVMVMTIHAEDLLVVMGKIEIGDRGQNTSIL